ncbi:MAG: CAP domain-containing protein [Pseudomonadota bacterium]
MSTANAREQLFIELINNARLDPLSEANRLDVSLNGGLDAGTITRGAKQPLAPNDILQRAADGHSEWMVREGILRSSPGEGGSNAEDRITEEGYDLTGSWVWAESTAGWGFFDSRDFDASATIFNAHRVLFQSSQNREIILDERFREIGVGTDRGQFTFSEERESADAVLATVTFAKTGEEDDFFITGVFFRDRDGDDFYDIGEGQKGTVRTGGERERSGYAGGYAIAVDETASQTVRLTSGGAEAVVDVRVGENVKLDFVNRNEIKSSADTELVSGVRIAELLGVANLDLSGRQTSDRLFGNSGNNDIDGDRGGDRIFGRDGRDELSGQRGNDILSGGDGRDSLSGGDGRDELDGGAGRDDLEGGKDNDRLVGGDGDDRLEGGSGGDRLEGGAGADVLIGGGGSDWFRFKEDGGFDRIRDFRPNEDQIDLRAFGGVDRFSDLDIENRGGEAVLDLGSTRVRFEDVAARQFDSGDFLF